MPDKKNVLTYATWPDLERDHPDSAGDDRNVRQLKHGYRWGVRHGAIDPDSEAGKALWRKFTC